MDKKDIYKDIDYILCVKNNRTLLNLSGEDVEGKSLKWLQEVLGEKVGEGVHQVQIKKQGEGRIINKRIRGILPSHKIGLDRTKEISEAVIIEQTERRARSSKNPDEVSGLFKMQRDLFEEQIKILRKRNALLEDEVEFWKRQHNKKEPEQQSAGGLEQLLMNALLSKFSGKQAAQHSGLADQVPAAHIPAQAQVLNIPPEVLAVIKTVDFDKTNPSELASSLDNILKLGNIPRKD